MSPDQSNIDSLPPTRKAAGEHAATANAVEGSAIGHRSPARSRVVGKRHFDPSPAEASCDPSTEDFSVDLPFPEPSEGDTPTPARLGRYVLFERLGGGGMGIVFRALDTELKRAVALKTIREGVFAESHEVERFTNEALAIAKLHHPHIVSILDIGRDQGHHYFTMQLATGGTLASRLHEFCTANPRQSIVLMEKIARAVHCAHEHNI